MFYNFKCWEVWPLHKKNTNFDFLTRTDLIFYSFFPFFRHKSASLFMKEWFPLYERVIPSLWKSDSLFMTEPFALYEKVIPSFKNGLCFFLKRKIKTGLKLNLYYTFWHCKREQIALFKKAQRAIHMKTKEQISGLLTGCQTGVNSVPQSYPWGYATILFYQWSKQ